GFFVENLARQRGDQLVAGIERCSLPVYCLFFALAGISLNVRALIELWRVALILIVIRYSALWLGTMLGGRLSFCAPEVGRWGWVGFIANAGVLLAIASVVARTFPVWGTDVQTLVVAIIGVDLLVGPIAFRYALIRTGEAQEDREYRLEEG
ncbi:MAG TPA: hypothetical protein PLZ55_08480, partial [bacterium]|nr:hypothetical protein [bacterium]